MSFKEILERRFYPKGTVIFNEGEEGFIAFIIQSGRVSVFSKKDGKKIEFTQLGAGDIFGETSLITEQPRSASVEAIEDSNMIIIRRDVFEKKLNKSDPTIQAVVEMLSNRIVNSNVEMLKSKASNVDSFIVLLNQLFKDILESMPENEKEDFKSEAFPLMGQLIRVLEKNRSKFK